MPKPIVGLKTRTLPDDILVVQFGSYFRVSIIDHLSLRIILKMNGIRDAVIWEETTLIGPNLLSLFLEGLFFFRLIPPAILNQDKIFCNVFPIR